MKIIYEDTRQQAGKHRNIEPWMNAHGIELRRTKLYVGDYTLPTDQSVCIDTKYGLQEVYSNLIGPQHERFTAEAKSAKETGIKLIILVEQGDIKSIDDVPGWKNPRIERYERIKAGKLAGGYRNVTLQGKPPVSSEQLARTMRTVSERYGVDWLFCRKYQTAGTICELLGVEWWR